MPDLLTHAAAGFFVGRKLFFDYRLGFILIGSILPDLVSRIPQILLQRFLELPVAHFFSAFHTPAAFVVFCYLTSFLFSSSIRKHGFWLMLSGSMLHFALDLLQKQFHKPIYMPWFPFSLEPVQIAWFHIHASLLAAPVLFLVMLYVWFKEQKRKCP